MIIRKARIDDLQRITDIYNQAILNTVATFDTETKTVTDRLGWFNSHDEKYSIMVAEEDEIVGWVSLSRWSDRCAYANTAELSVYVDDQNRGRGIGKLLIQEILNHAQEINCHTIIARIAGENQASIKLHKKYGFRFIGTMQEVGFKFGRYIDVHLYQIILNNSSK